MATPTSKSHPSAKSLNGSDLNWLQKFVTYENQPQNRIVVLEAVNKQHPWAQNAERALNKHAEERGIIDIVGDEFPAMRVTWREAPRLLRILSTFLYALEKRRISFWLDEGNLFVLVHGETIHVKIREDCSRRFLSEREKAQKRAELGFFMKNSVDMPTGYLRVFMSHQEVGYVHSVTENGRKPLARRLNEVMIALGRMAETIKQRRAAQQIEREQRKAYWADWDRQWQEKKLSDHRMAQFSKLAQKWEEMQKLKAFLPHMERYIVDLPLNHEARAIAEVAKSKLAVMDSQLHLMTKEIEKPKLS
jgi:hypothetical protein